MVYFHKGVNVQLVLASISMKGVFFFLNEYSLSNWWIFLKVREDQEKKRLEEEVQSHSLPPQQQVSQQSGLEVSQSQPVLQPAAYVAPQPTQHSTQISGQPASQQSIQSSSYSTAQSTNVTGMSQGLPQPVYVPQSSGQVQVPIQGQSVSGIQPESEESESDQHLQQTGGGIITQSERP